MLFNSVPFLAYFLPVVVVVALLLGRAGQKEACKVWLLLASAFFYGYWAWPYLFLLFGTIIVNFFTGKMLSAPDRAQGQRRAIMIASVSFNLGLLFVFKYFNFFIENIDFLFGFDIQVFKVILPLGISFFTFQQIAFLADAYQRKLDEGYSFVDYALFISFFPQLIAGPIVHHKDLVPQFKSGLFARPTSEMFASGVAIIIIGLFKKAVLADSISPAVNTLFGEAAAGAHLTLMEAWLATLGFAGQIYFDFSGYSDIAIGLALLFGLRMPENFRAPYRAISIVEFWRRWHITLSDFLRDYLYIPLGGNRRGKVRRYINLMTTMLLGGLWHGAAWTFVIWGGLHGAYLTVNHMFNGEGLRLRNGPFEPAGSLLGLGADILRGLLRLDLFPRRESRGGQQCRARFLGLQWGEHSARAQRLPRPAAEVRDKDARRVEPVHGRIAMANACRGDLFHLAWPGRGVQPDEGAREPARPPDRRRGRDRLCHPGNFLRCRLRRIHLLPVLGGQS